MITPDQIDLILPVAPWDDISPAFAAQFQGWKGKIWAVGPEPPAHLGRLSGAEFVKSPLGRGKQLNLGARRSTAPYLWFVHVDSSLPTDFARVLSTAINGHPASLLYFDLSFGDQGPRLMKLNAGGVWLRSHVLGLPFGDQGFCLPREVFWQLGGYDENAPYGEDHLLVWAAHRSGIPVKGVGATITTSPRKYQKKGWWMTTSQHVKLTFLQAMPQLWKLIRRVPPT